jgi:hypothetical protein
VNAIRFFQHGTSPTNGEPLYNQCTLDNDDKCTSKGETAKCGNQCPTCGDLSKYNYPLKGDDWNASCTRDLDMCSKCLNGVVDFTAIGRYNNYTDNYKGICPKSGSYVGKEYTECDDNKSKCINDLQTILTDTMNSSGQCSIKDLYNKIKGNGEVTFNCKGNNNINGEEAWLDEALSSVGDGYCKPNNDTWKCNRDDIPSYCKNGQCVLTGNTNNKTCGCPKGTLIDKYGKCTKAVQYCPEKNKFNGGLAPGKTSCFPLTAVDGIKCEDYYAGDNESNNYMCSGTLLCTEDKDKPCAIKL